ncbi:MAG: hypothetical protein ACYTGR_16515 [Planctomycetota bacterium]
MTATTITLLTLQSTLALAGLALLRHGVLPGLAQMRHPALMLDIWGPMMLVLPLLGLAVTTPATIGAGGWIGLGGPVVVAWLGLATGLLAARSRVEIPPVSTVALWTAAGAILLLLGATHEMAVWMGQCSFAAAAVMLWIFSPLAPDRATSTSTSIAGRRAGLALFAAVGGAVGQAAIAASLPPEAKPIAGALAIGTATVGLALIAAQAGASSAIRVGGWIGTYGVLMGLGVISLAHVIPQLGRIAASAIAGDPAPLDVSTAVARGFGSVAAEATALIVLAPVAHILAVRGGRVRWLLGTVILVAAAVVAGIRLTRLA